MLIAFNKPFAVLSQFNSDQSPNRTLAEFGFPPGVYPVGRLDADSEGLLILSDQPEWNARLLRPGKGHEREYWVQVEGVATPEKLQRLSTGVVIQGRAALPCVARALEHPPDFPPRNPPIRFRKTVPDCWLSIILREGRNRQVRRMTAAVGLPTLRLVRVRIGKLQLKDLAPGDWVMVGESDI
ncbi:MAG TPA: pseudouridine synthase [Chthoniobacterales bacterium]|jgi:23S rRNA pseudouridine2457 synthase|nr:pseudouridine synthase [Chthoniobacterales bacterium]